MVENYSQNTESPCEEEETRACFYNLLNPRLFENINLIFSNNMEKILQFIIPYLRDQDINSLKLTGFKDEFRRLEKTRHYWKCRLFTFLGFETEEDSADLKTIFHNIAGKLLHYRILNTNYITLFTELTDRGNFDRVFNQKQEIIVKEMIRKIIVNRKPEFLLVMSKKVEVKKLIKENYELLTYIRINRLEHYFNGIFSFYLSFSLSRESLDPNNFSWLYEYDRYKNTSKQELYNKYFWDNARVDPTVIQLFCYLGDESGAIYYYNSQKNKSLTVDDLEYLKGYAISFGMFSLLEVLNSIKKYTPNIPIYLDLLTEKSVKYLLANPNQSYQFRLIKDELNYELAMQLMTILDFGEKILTELRHKSNLEYLHSEDAKKLLSIYFK